MRIHKWHVSAAGIALLFVIIIGYGYARTRPLVEGVDLSVETITDGAAYTNPLQTISGTAEHARVLEVNGNPVGVSLDGTFTYQLLLQPGYNIIRVYAEDKFGTARTRTYRVTLTDNTYTHPIYYVQEETDEGREEPIN